MRRDGERRLFERLKRDLTELDKEHGAVGEVM